MKSSADSSPHSYNALLLVAVMRVLQLYFPVTVYCVSPGFLPKYDLRDDSITPHATLRDDHNSNTFFPSFFIQSDS